MAGHDVLEQPLDVKKQIGYLPESPPLYTDMTVIKFLNFAAKIKKVDRTNRHRNLEKIMDLVRIGDVRGRLIKNLSKGYRQRVG